MRPRASGKQPPSDQSTLVYHLCFLPSPLTPPSTPLPCKLTLQRMPQQTAPTPRPSSLQPLPQLSRIAKRRMHPPTAQAARLASIDPVPDQRGRLSQCCALLGLLLSLRFTHHSQLSRGWVGARAMVVLAAGVADGFLAGFLVAGSLEMISWMRRCRWIPQDWRLHVPMAGGTSPSSSLISGVFRVFSVDFGEIFARTSSVVLMAVILDLSDNGV